MTAEIIILANEYLAAFDAWQIAYNRANIVNCPNGNEAESIVAINAYQTMVAARDALIAANK